MTHENNPRKANGHSAPLDLPSGPALHSPERDTLPVHREHAASDDVTGAFVAIAAAASEAAAGANRDACAEAAQAEALGKPPASSGAGARTNGAGTSPDAKPPKEKASKKKKPNGKKPKDTHDAPNAPEIPPGTEALPIDGPEFVEAVHERMDLIALQVKLLRSGDEKITQRELACLRELRYGKTLAPPAEDESTPINYDQRPDRGTKAAE